MTQVIPLAYGVQCSTHSVATKGPLSPFLITSLCQSLISQPFVIDGLFLLGSEKKILLGHAIYLFTKPVVKFRLSRRTLQT